MNELSQSATDNAPLEQERRNDDQMWQLMRYLMSATGHAEKVSMFDTLWARTATPQQWNDHARLVATTPPATAANHPIARLCAQQQTNGFSRVFQTACAATTNVADLFAGLALWSAETKQSQLQGRHDWALHFIYGGAAEAMLHAGNETAVEKESWDKFHGRPFDRNDLAASLAGAAWVREVRRHPQWQTRWATGELNLDYSLPRLQYGSDEPSARELANIQRDIRVAFQLTEESNLTGGADRR